MLAIDGIRGDMVLSACLRYDCAPIPVTLEAEVRTTQQNAAQLADGALIRVNELDFRIVHSAPVKNAGGVTQGKQPMSATSITAFLDGCVGVAKPRRAAVVFQNTSFAAIYRACGATAAVAGNVNIGRFACLIGKVPSFMLAQVLQEEAAIMAWRDKKVTVMRLRDLLQQTPVDSLQIEDSEDIRSGFLEDDEIPVYFSVGSDGKFITGNRTSPTQTTAYSPRKNARELAYMSRVLVRRKVITSAPNLPRRAGDVVTVRGTPHVILTAAHYTANNEDGSGVNQYSKFWLGSLAS